MQERYRVFRKDLNGHTYYSVGISRKNKEGGYDKGYMPIRFLTSLDYDIPNFTDISVSKSFISVYLNRYKKPVFYIVVQEFKLIK